MKICKGKTFLKYLQIQGPRLEIENQISQEKLSV